MIFFLLFVLPFFLWFPIVLLISSLGVGSFGQGLAALISAGVFVLGFVGYVVWGCWIAPVIRAGSICHLYWGNKNPRVLSRGIGFTPFMPVLWILFVSGYFVFIYLNILRPPDAPPFPYLAWSIATLIIAFALLVIAIPVRFWTQRRLKQTLLLENICFECGYQLRDTASNACPECGEPAPMAPSTNPSA